MNKAFLFDMDGVLVDSEPAWDQFQAQMLERVLGKDGATTVRPAPGSGVDKVFQKAREAGLHVTKEDIVHGFDSIFKDVYANSPITKGLTELGVALARLNYRIGLVTQSPQKWIDCVLPHVPFKDAFEAIVSLDEHPELRTKPEPDGFLEACRMLDADPQRSIVLEDSNYGIAAGKAAGCFVIGFRGNLIPGYAQEGADAYADTMEDVIELVEKFTRR